jgi:hypothetical protein
MAGVVSGMHLLCVIQMKIVLADIQLKTFLEIFDGEDQIQIVELGDVGHPSSGFVDETILGNVDRINQILDFDYDFEGLVYFEAYVQEIKVVYHNQAYELTGNRTRIDKLLSKIKLKNAQSASKPPFTIVFMER